MGPVRQVYEMMKAGAIAHAKWDMEVSTSIIRSKKRLLMIGFGILLLPIFAYLLPVDAAQEMLGSKTALAPAFYSMKIFFVSIAVGLIAWSMSGARTIMGMSPA